MIVGQDRIIKLIDSISLDDMPRSLIIEGYKGSGKHLVCDYISKHLNIPILDITNNLDNESIENYYLRSEPYLYIIDGNKLTTKNQNSILKFLEEPLKNSFIIIIIDNKYNILDTILNRAQVWKLDTYTKDILRKFSDDESILKIAKTPGDIERLRVLNIASEFEFINKIVDKISIASFPNTLTLSNHIGFNSEQDKIDLDLFFRLMLNVIRDKILSGEDLFEMFNLTSETFKKYQGLQNLDKKYVFDNYISKMWEISHKGG